MQSAPTHPCFPWFFASSLVSFTAEGSLTAKVREAADVQKFNGRSRGCRSSVLCVYRHRFITTQIVLMRIRSSVCTHLSKPVWRLPFLWVLDTRVCTHTPSPTLNLHGIVSELETQPDFDLHFPTLQDAGILTPSGLFVKANLWETLV